MQFPIDPSTQIQVFATTGSEYLADGIVDYLPKRFEHANEPRGYIRRGQTTVNVFDNNNIEVVLNDNVRGQLAVVVHTQVVEGIHDKLVELLCLLDALRESHAAGTVLLFPYYPYARSDMKRKARVSVAAKLWAQIYNLLEVRHILIVQPHDEHIQHYPKPSANIIPLDSFHIHYIRETVLAGCGDLSTCSTVFADAGAQKRFGGLAEALGLDQAYLVKKRIGTRVEVSSVVGPVEGRTCLLIDDEVTSGGTLIEDAKRLKEAGAGPVISVLSHGVLSKRGMTQREVAQRLQDSALDRIVLTNTTPCEAVVAGLSKFEVLDIIPLLAEALRRFTGTGSLSEFWDPTKFSEIMS